MRAFLIAVVVLLFLGILSALYFSRSGRSLPGLDRSRFTESAAPGHTKVLREGDASARKDAATALWQIGGHAKEATPALMAAAKDTDPQVREAVVRALGRTGEGTQEVVPVLVAALKDPIVGVRAAAAGALAEIWLADSGAGQGPAPSHRPSAGPTGPGGRPGDSTSLSSPSRLSRPFETAARLAIPPLVEALRDADAGVRGNAASALAQTGPLAEPAIDNLIVMAGKEADDRARLLAVIALGNIGPSAKAAVPVLLDRLRHDKVDSIRANAAGGLGEIRCDAPVVVPALVEAFLREEFGDVRASAVMGLRQFGPEAKRALPLLQAAAKDPQYQQGGEVRQNIHRLLKQLERNLHQEATPAPAGGDPSRSPTPDKKG